MEKFSYEANGYNRSEVNQFISDVIDQTEGIITKCKMQNAEIEKIALESEKIKVHLEGLTVVKVVVVPKKLVNIVVR